MKNNEIRAANRKALPKFLLLTLVGAVIGGVMGYCAARYGLDQLSAALWLSSVSLVLAFFLIAATYSVGFASFDSWESTGLIFIGIAAFLAILVESILIQQKCVDAAKQMSPEKKASIYDLQFQKKWVDDCDEAEKIMIGKCAFKAYSAVNRVCAIAAIVLAICALVFGIGFLPSLAVCIIWMVNLSVYCKEAMRYAKAGNKIF